MKFVIAACILYFASAQLVSGQLVPFSPTKTSSDNMTVITVADDGTGTITKTSQNTTHVARITGQETNTTDTTDYKQE